MLVYKACMLAVQIKNIKTKNVAAVDLLMRGNMRFMALTRRLTSIT